MDISVITTALTGLDEPVYVGYPPTGAVLPYAVVRPYLVDVSDSSITGLAITWNYQQAIYCCGASTEASYNLAKLVMQTLQGRMATTMNYSGAAIEGRYESLVVAQAYEGAA